MKINIKIVSVLVGISLLSLSHLQAQNFLKDGKLFLNEEGTHYVKGTFMNQTWLRYNESNPGTLINGYNAPHTFDIGLRRTRMQLYGQITDRAFFYTQFGMNNFNSLSARKQGFFIMDATGEYATIKEKLSIGAGLMGWSGLGRFASPSAGTIMGLDAPLWEQATNDATDQFLRKLGVFAKGKLGKFDYRVSVAQPFAVQTTTASGVNTAISANANFSHRPAKLQYQGYFQYQFFDKEANLTPYTTGTYLGEKRVFNIGAGFVFQPQAMWNLQNADTITHNMQNFVVDAYYDAPINKEKGTALNAYLAYANLNFGPNYVRNIGAMNPATGVNTTTASLNGVGNAFPMVGTGNMIYGQVGYKFGKDLLKKAGTLMSYATASYSKFQRLNDTSIHYSAGVNWLMTGHQSKLTLAYENRPIFATNGDASGRKGAVIMQYQVFLK